MVSYKLRIPVFPSHSQYFLLWKEFCSWIEDVKHRVQGTKPPLERIAFPLRDSLISLPSGFWEPEGGDVLPTRSRGAAGEATQTSAALTSGRGCRPRSSPLALPLAAASGRPEGSLHHARIPQASYDCEMRKKGKMSLSVARVPCVRVQHGDLIASLSLRYL